MSGRRVVSGRRVGAGHAVLTARRLVHSGFALLLLTVATVPLATVYQDPALVTLAITAGVVGSLLAGIAAVRAWPALPVVVATLVAYLLVGVPLAVPSQAAFGVLPTGGGLRALVIGTVTSWKRMLSVDLPLGRYEALLVPALVVLLAAVVVAVSLTLRSRRPGLAVVPAVAVLAAGIALGGTTTTLPLAVGGAFVVVALAWGVWSGLGAGALSMTRVIAAALLVAVAVGGGTAIAMTRPPSSDRAVLRDAVAPPFDPDHYVSPLVGYRTSVLPPNAVEPMLRVTGLPDGALLRVATLDSYDGLAFTVGDGRDTASSGTFARVPSAVDRGTVDGERVSLGVSVEGYRGVWLPTAGDVSRVRFDANAPDTDYYLNATTSTAALPGGVVSEERYTVDTAIAGATSLDRLAELRPGSATQPVSSALPAALAATVKAHSDGATTPGGRLAALTRWLRSGYVSDSGDGEPFSAAGHSAGRIQKLLTSSPVLGDAEQYAPALALLARQVGFPSRVVVGYAKSGSDDDTSTAGATGSTTFTGADLTARVEVETSGGSWVSIDPNPEKGPVPPTETTPSESVARPQTVLPPPPPEKNDAAVSQNRDGQKASREPAAPGWLEVLAAVARVGLPIVLVLGIVTSPLWVIALARLLRRRRRRASDAREVAASGAWDEVRDTIDDAGFDVDASATRTEIAALVGTPEVQRLAAETERSVFSTQVLDSADVDRLWREADAAKISVIALAPTRWQRLRFRLTARSLWASARRLLDDLRSRRSRTRMGR